MKVNHNRSLNVIRSPRICDLQTIELIDTPQVFDPLLVEQLAHLLLESGNLATPLLLRRHGSLKYTLVAGELEYQAALKAREIEPSFKDVAAYILDGEIEQNMRQQRQISFRLGISQQQPTETNPELYLSSRGASSGLSSGLTSSSQLAQPAASYTVTPQPRTTTGHNASTSSKNQPDLSAILTAIQSLETHLLSHLGDGLANRISDQLSDVITKVMTDLMQPLSQPLSQTSSAPEPAPINESKTNSEPVRSLDQDHDAKASPPSSSQPTAKPLPNSKSSSSKNISQKPSPKPEALATPDLDVESAIIHYFNTQPITKAFLQSLTVGEKASRKIQAAVPQQLQISPFLNGADLQQRIPEIGPVIWEKIQLNWRSELNTNTATSTTVINAPVPEPAPVTAIAKDTTEAIPEPIPEAIPEAIPENITERITETITEILTESIAETVSEAKPQQITLEIPAEIVVEPVVIPTQLQRLNGLLTTGEGMYQLLIELKNLGLTHRIAQKFIDTVHRHAPFTTFSDLQKLSGLNATNWRYFLQAFPEN